MKVKSLELKNFRNYDEESFEFDENVNIIHGFNAQGKTNILEAIYIMSTGRSHRNAKETEMIRFEESCAKIASKFYSHNRENIIFII